MRKIEKVYERIAHSIITKSNDLVKFELREGESVYGQKNKLGWEYVNFGAVFYSILENRAYVKWSVSKRFDIINRFSSNNPCLLKIPPLLATCAIPGVDVFQEIRDTNIQGRKFYFSADDIGLLQFTSVSEDLIYNRLLPYSNKFNNIHYLNEYYNSEVNGENMKSLGGGFEKLYNRIIISRLAGGKYIDELLKDVNMRIYMIKEEAALGPISSGQQEFMDIYPLFMQEIEKLEPLENPDLFSEDNLKYLR